MNKLKKTAFYTIYRRLKELLQITQIKLFEIRRLACFGLSGATKVGRCGYSILRLCHSIEKGLSYGSSRLFGSEKITNLICLLSNSPDITSYEEQMGYTAIEAWVHYCKSNGFENNETCQLAVRFLSGRQVEEAQSAVRCSVDIVERPHSPFDFETYLEFIASRRSCRSFEGTKLSMSAIEDCTKLFVAAPSACNRQMSRLYALTNESDIEKASALLNGIGGIGHKGMTLFVVTYDLASIGYPDELNQGYLNAGLAAMNFVNALHCYGVGSTFIQWSNSKNDSKKLRSIAGIPEYEDIAVVIAAGYYPERMTVLSSSRRPLYDVLSIIK